MAMTMSDEFYQNELRLAGFCMALGITKIRVTFDGSGDSGSIDDAEFEAPNLDSDDIAKMELLVWVPGPRLFNERTKGWESSGMTEELTAVGDFVKEHVDEALSATHVDWYNNEGGFGAWEWTPGDGVSFEVNQRHLSHNTEYMEERRLGTPDLSSPPITDD